LSEYILLLLLLHAAVVLFVLPLLVVLLLDILLSIALFLCIPKRIRYNTHLIVVALFISINRLMKRVIVLLLVNNADVLLRCLRLPLVIHNLVHNEIDVPKGYYVSNYLAL
jgi:hypothetical protein